MVQPLWKTVWWFLKKLKIKLLHTTPISLLGIYPKDLKSGSQRDISTTVFTKAFFAKTKMGKQPECPLTDEWIRKMWYLHTIEYHSSFFFLGFYILFIYSWETHTERGGHIGRGRSRLYAGSPMWDLIPGLQDHALSRRQMLDHWATQTSLIHLLKMKFCCVLQQGWTLKTLC